MSVSSAARATEAGLADASRSMAGWLRPLFCEPGCGAWRSAGELVAMDRRYAMKKIGAALVLAGLLITPAQAETVTYLQLR